MKPLAMRSFSRARDAMPRSGGHPARYPARADGKQNLTAGAAHPTPQCTCQAWQRINQKYRRNIAADIKHEETNVARELVPANE